MTDDTKSNSQIANMNLSKLIYELPHIVALEAELLNTREAVDIPGRLTRRESICPVAADAYNKASHAYFAAVDAAQAELKTIEASIASAFEPEEKATNDS